MKADQIVFIKELPKAIDDENIVLCYEFAQDRYSAGTYTKDEIEKYCKITSPNPNRTIEDGLHMGDIIVNPLNGARKVLGVVGEVNFLSFATNFNSVSDYYTLSDLIKDEYKLKSEVSTSEEEVIEELTMEELCTELGRTVKIKK